MKKQEAKNRKKVRPSEEALNYLYILALDDKKYTAAQNATVDYLVKNMAERTGEFTIAGKAFAADIALYRLGYFMMGNRECSFGWGLNINNIGSKIAYGHHAA